MLFVLHHRDGLPRAAEFARRDGGLAGRDECKIVQNSAAARIRRLSIFAELLSLLLQCGKKGRLGTYVGIRTFKHFCVRIVADFAVCRPSK